MTKMPAKPKKTKKRELGERIRNISETGDLSKLDVRKIRDCFERAGGDATEVEPQIMFEAPYPGVTVRIPEHDLFVAGKAQFVADVGAGSYDYDEYQKQVAKQLLVVAQADHDNRPPGVAPMTQEQIDALAVYLDSKPEFKPNAALPPDEFYDYLVGDYICRHCY